MFPEFFNDDSFMQLYFATYGVSLAFNLLISVVAYILIAIGLSRMAKACNYPRPWLAWIPYGSSFLIGKLAEISAGRFGKKKIAYGLWLVILQVVTTLVGFFYVGVLFSVLFSGLSEFAYSASTIQGGVDQTAATLVALVLVLLLILALSIVQAILQYIALYLVFKLFDEKNAMIYLILCIFVSIAMPIVMLIVSKKSPNLPTQEPVEETTASQTPADNGTEQQ